MTRLIVDVRSPLPRPKMILEPGSRLRVGRDAEHAFPTDGQMSAQHFELSWDGARAILRDLESAKGTWLQGERVSAAPVAHGAWIRAGLTDFIVYVESATPPQRDRSKPAKCDAITKSAALAQLRGEASLFALIDASRDKRTLELLREATDPHFSLYEGIKGLALGSVAPYLVELRADSALLDRLVGEAWGEGWGSYLVCRRPATEVRRQLRRHLMVEDEETLKRYYFRFADPTVLRRFLPALTLRQRADFFGDIDAFITEGDTGQVLRFTREGAC